MLLLQEQYIPEYARSPEVYSTGSAYLHRGLASPACSSTMSDIEEKTSSVGDVKAAFVEASELICEEEPEAQLRKRVLRKLDMRLLPVATILYLLAYL